PPKHSPSFRKPKLAHCPERLPSGMGNRLNLFPGSRPWRWPSLGSSEESVPARVISRRLFLKRCGLEISTWALLTRHSAQQLPSSVRYTFHSKFVAVVRTQDVCALWNPAV